MPTGADRKTVCRIEGRVVGCGTVNAVAVAAKSRKTAAKPDNVNVALFILNVILDNENAVCFVRVLVRMMGSPML